MKFLLIIFISINLFGNFKDIRVLDKQTLQPIKGAMVSSDRGKVRTNSKGKASVEVNKRELYIKAYGYRQQNVNLSENVVLLEPFTSKALYVSFWAAGSKKYMRRIMELAKTTEINTVIIDVKNEFGSISYKTDVKMAKVIGAHNERTIYHIEEFIQELKEHGLYVIARIVVFKDDRLARKFNSYALKDGNATVWRNREKLAWVDPFETKVHDYVASVAADAASRGFDEINFDYVRFPLKKGLVYKEATNQKNRIKAISAFLQTANKALAPYNVYTSVDTYGYVCWNKHDTNIGHTIKSLAAYSDYIAPMLYPSGFGAGILGYKNPTDHSYEIINESIKMALTKDNISGARFRPWLQSFKDYGFDRKFFRSKEISEQIKGAEDAKCSGWLLWNPSSRFSAKGLQDNSQPYPVLCNSKDSMEKCGRYRDVPELIKIP